MLTLYPKFQETLNWALKLRDELDRTKLNQTELWQLEILQALSDVFVAINSRSETNVNQLLDKLLNTLDFRFDRDKHHDSMEVLDYLCEIIQSLIGKSPVERGLHYCEICKSDDGVCNLLSVPETRTSLAALLKAPRNCSKCRVPVIQKDVSEKFDATNSEKSNFHS